MPAAPGSPQFYADYLAQFTSQHDPKFQNIGDFPSWLQPSGTGPLQRQMAGLPQAFNVNPFVRSTKQALTQGLDMQRSAAAAAGNAAGNRASLYGGSVGSSFGTAGLMQNANNQYSKGIAGINQFKAQSSQDMARLAAQLAAQQTSANQNHQGMLSDYTLRTQGMNAGLFAAANARNGQGYQNPNGGAGGNDPSQFNPGYITNSGPIQGGSGLPGLSASSGPNQWGGVWGQNGTGMPNTAQAFGSPAGKIGWGGGDPRKPDWMTNKQQQPSYGQWMNSQPDAPWNV